MSPLISCQSISKSFGAHPLFSNISLGFLEDERLGLIGPNGTGKSTLLKIFANLETVDSGEVVQRRNTNLIYLSQEDQLDSEKTIEETLTQTLPEEMDDTERYQDVTQIIRQMEFENPEQQVGSLSGGWRKRLSIAQALIQKPDLLLMDEPTNHLDMEGILWLEKLLQQASFAFVLVSHDRYFLENTTNRIVELNKQYPEGFLKIEGNYSIFLQRREEFMNEQTQREQILSNKVRRELEWLSRGPKARTTKARFRIDNAHQLQDELSEVKKRNSQNKTAQIDFEATHRKTKKLIEVKELKMTRGGVKLFDNLNVELSPGKCLGLIGRNGSGKSTLMQLFNGNLSPDSGVIKKADGVQIVNFDQNREQLDPNLTLKEALSSVGDSVVYQGRSLHIVSWAKRFLFPSDQLGQPVAQLSGGEQARVLIANLMLMPADVLLLDEPTNDLDIPTLEILEESLKEFPGAIVLITHDRFLLDRLSDQILYLDGEGTAEYYADYNQWYDIQQAAIHKTDTIEGSSQSKKPASEVKGSKKISYEEKKELNRIDKKIQKAEEIVASFQEKIQDPEVMNDSVQLTELCKQLQDAEEKVDQFYRRWEELEELNQQ